MKPSAKLLFIYTAIFYVLLSAAPNKISLGGITALYGLLLFKIFGNIRLAIGSLYIILFPIMIGKTFVIDLITAQYLDIPGRPFGISADMTIGFGDAVIVAMALYMFVRPLEFIRSSVRVRWLELLLFLYPLGVIIATVFGSARPDISLMHSLYSLRPLIVYYFFSAQKSLSMTLVLSMLSVGVCLEVAVVFGQMLVSGPLGISIEPITNYITVDISREAAGLLRFSGTYMHANALGNALILPLIMLFPVLMHRFEQKPYITPYVWMMGMGTFILTMSRSAWGGFVFAVVVYLLLIWIKWRYRFQFIYPLHRYVVGVLVCISIVLFAMMIPRLVSTLSSGGRYGSIETRALLMKEYAQVIATHPMFGVGLEMDVYTAYLRSFVRGDPNIDSANRSVLQYFPEPVHNGVARLLVQVGIVGTLPYLAVYIGGMYLMWRYIHTAKIRGERLLAAAIFCAYIGTGVNSMMQPILPDLQYLMVLTMIGAQNTS